jgi:predicted acyl esterase
MDYKPEASSEMREYQNERLEVKFRKAAPIDAPEARYPGFKPGSTILTKGYVHKKGALPLPTDLLFERDVAVTLRDGTVICADVFRPAGGTNLPAIIAWSPYGKEAGMTLLDDFPGRAGVPQGAVSELQKWEGPDPGYWCGHGYAIVNPDSRGAYNSNGDIQAFGGQDGRDGYDVVEWVAARDWSNGKVAFSGNSWLAVSQWFIAAEQPPHLAAIAPWEGLCDQYREDVARGGIPNAEFCAFVIKRMRGKNHVEDVPAMLQKYPLMNGYWEDKSAKLEKIRVPAYVVASWTSGIHTHGTLDGFRRISSEDKWLRVHNTQEWPDYYTPENMEDLRRFFDHYLKGIENGWEKTPRVRLSVLDPGGIDQVNHPENEFPLKQTQCRSLYLDAATGTLSPDPVAGQSEIRYKADDGQGQAVFSITFSKETELIGYMKLRLWVEASGSNDMDLFVLVQKLDEQGNILSPLVWNRPAPVPTGRLRVSHRELDGSRSTAFEPVHTHRREQLLIPGQIVPVDIGLWPIGMLWHKGQQLRILVAGYDPVPPLLPMMAQPATRNKGEHIIHTGGKFDSHLLVPKIPR